MDSHVLYEFDTILDENQRKLKELEEYTRWRATRAILGPSRTLTVHQIVLEWEEMMGIEC